MKKTRTQIEVSKLQLNTGQMQWLPKNPRQWTQTDLDRTKQSITEDEDFLEDRPVLVVPNGKKYCVFAGNLRTTALQELKAKTTHAIVYEPETDDDRAVVIRRAMKDNGSFGSWDFDTLANEWDSLPLSDWGVPAWGASENVDVDSFFEDYEPPTEKEEKLIITITIPKSLEDKMADIKASLSLTLEEWKGCEIK